MIIKMCILTGCIILLFKTKTLFKLNIRILFEHLNPRANKQHIASLRYTNLPAFVKKQTGHFKWEKQIQRINFCQKYTQQTFAFIQERA